MKIKENYAAIERTVALVKEKFGADSKIAVMFEKCISNTLQTTIKIKENDQKTGGGTIDFWMKYGVKES